MTVKIPKLEIELISVKLLKCYMLEIDPVYCDVIIQRWEKLTGEVAVKIGE